MRLLLSSLASPFLEYLVRQLNAENRQVILSLLEPERGARMLDCGCGDGGFAKKAAEKVGARDIFGVEILEEDAEKARTRGIQVYLGDLNLGLPFADGSFDVVLGVHVIEHLHATDLFLKEIRRVLRDGGYAVLQTPNLAALYNIVYLLLGKQPVGATVSDEVLVGTWGGALRPRLSPRGPAHRRMFTLVALRQLLEYHGFSIVKTASTGYLPLPAPLSRAPCLVDKGHAVDITIKARKDERQSPLPAATMGGGLAGSSLSGLGQRFSLYLAGQAELDYRRRVLSLLERDPEARLLDCGCGQGEFTQKMAEKLGTRSIYGIDVVEQKIEASRERGIEVVQGDLNERLPFSDESLDVVTAVQVIEHLSNTDLFVRELHRILRTGAYAIVVTPNLASIHNILYLLLGKQPVTASVSDEFLVGTWYPGEKKLDAVHQQPSHQRVFTSGALKGLFEYHGFEVERAVGTGFFPLPTSLARVMCLVDARHAIHLIIKARKRD